MRFIGERARPYLVILSMEAQDIIIIIIQVKKKAFNRLTALIEYPSAHPSPRIVLKTKQRDLAIST